MSTLSAKERIIYQIYPKSFKDSNGDGIGDLKGITAKLKYLKQLGINTIWLNPIYVSPQIDNGYDVADYYQIDEKLGTMADFDELVAKAHALGLDIILDFVMNHTSDQHPWFQAALKDKDSEFRNCYLWHQGKMVVHQIIGAPFLAEVCGKKILLTQIITIFICLQRKCLI